MGRDARIAGQDQAGALLDQPLQALAVQAVPLLTGRHAVDGIRAQGQQRLPQQGRRRLAVGVKVAPDGDAVALADSLPQVPDG